MRRRIMISVALVSLSAVTIAHAVVIRDVAFKTRNAGKVVFSHTSHLKQPKMADNCKACHDSIFSMKKKVRYTMADMDKGKSCGACHDGKKAFPLGECARCHQVKEITYSVATTGPTRFSHQKHLSATPDCGSCHPKLFAAGPNKHATMADMRQGKSCGACHDGKKAFGIERCTTCHPVRDQKYAVKGAGTVTFSHSTHTGLYACDKCHSKLYGTGRSKTRVSMKSMEKGKSCGACHNAKTAFSVKENCATCHKTN